MNEPDDHVRAFLEHCQSRLLKNVVLYIGRDTTVEDAERLRALGEEFEIDVQVWPEPPLQMPG
jgi:hypothetical protein